MKAIQLDGSAGGGQMLRTALTLSMITGQPFRIVNIRGKRKSPGLKRQHLTCVKAACEISGGTVDGAEIGSCELVFSGGEIKGGSYQFAIGTAGSTGLLLQTLLPALWNADAPSTLRLEGGTHNPLAPPFEFLERVYLPALREMGVEAEMKLLESGFAPAGGGVIECSVEPCTGPQPLERMARGELVSSRVRVPVRHLPVSIAGRILDAALVDFPCDDAQVEVREPGPGKGVLCQLEASFENGCEMACCFGEHRLSAERVGRRAGKSMKSFLGGKAAVGRYLGDQLLLPLALAGGGSFTTTAPDDHFPSNISVIEKFLPVKFVVDPQQGGVWAVRVEPRG